MDAKSQKRLDRMQQDELDRFCTANKALNDRVNTQVELLATLRTENAKLTLERMEIDAKMSDVEADNAQLRAAIGTPEVCAGVVSEVVERERDEAIKELARIQRKFAAFELHQASTVITSGQAENTQLQAQLADAMAVIDKLPKWISVEDSLPPMFEDCIVHGRQERENVCTQSWQARRWTGCTQGFDVERDKLWEWITPCDFHISDVTHWMPLPSEAAAQAAKENTGG